MDITLDKQVVNERCPECNQTFVVVRGSVFGDGQPVGLYLIALHGHSPDGRLGHLAIGLLNSTAKRPQAYAAAMQVVAMPHQFNFSLVEWPSSPWRNETYLGRMLGPSEIRANPHRGTFFHIAEHVVDDLPEARSYFG